jgi:hypothetical protein
MRRIPRSQRTFHKVQKALLDRITENASILVTNVATKMLPGSIIVFDGSWSDHRGAEECILVFVDCRRNKIVDFENIQKSKSGFGSN